MEKNMKEKIILITGANSGIGLSATKIFANAGHTVIMGCRSIERSKEIRQEIIEKSGNTKIDLMKLDLSSMSSIKDFANEFKQKYQKLDVLINNAAYVEHGADYKLSPDNIELTFATNVVGPFLLSNLLVENLKNSDDARILNASSNIIKHFFSPKKEIDLQDLHSEQSKSHNVYNTYRNSKMALVMLTFKMAKEYMKYGIKVNALQINGAKMSKNTINKFTLKWRLIAHIQNIFFPATDYMASKYFEICTSDQFKDISGKLINDKLEIMKQGPENPSIKIILGTEFYPKYADNQEITEKIWKLCSELTSKLNL